MKYVIEAQDFRGLPNELCRLGFEGGLRVDNNALIKIQEAAVEFDRQVWSYEEVEKEGQEVNLEVLLQEFISFRESCKSDGIGTPSEWRAFDDEVERLRSSL